MVRIMVWEDKSVVLKESKKLLTDLLRYIDAAVFIVDENVKIQSINESFKRVFRKNEEQVLDKLCGNAIGCGPMDADVGWSRCRSAR